jgi:hypothetical protein
MTFRDVTRSNLVDDASGCPVVVNEDRSLATLAISRIAHGANTIHSISFNPSVRLTESIRRARASGILLAGHILWEPDKA